MKPKSIIFVILCVALIVCNLYTLRQVKSLSNQISNLNNTIDSTVLYNSNDTLNTKMDEILKKLDDANILTQFVGYSVLSNDSASKCAKIELHFLLNERNAADKVTVQLSNSSEDLSGTAILTGGIYKVEFTINTTSNYKAIVHIESKTGYIETALLSDDIHYS